MGIIQKQGIKSSYYIFLGFLIGAVNLLVLFPMYFSKNDQGLVRAMIDIGATLSVFCTLGSLPVIYKFFPFYNHYLGKEKNELPFLTLLINLLGFSILMAIGWSNKDFIIRKLGKSPSLANYFNYIYIYTFFLLLFYWLEAFAWGLHKGVLTNFLRETSIRILTTILILIFGLGLINLTQFIALFSGIYALPMLYLMYHLIQSKEWSFRTFTISSVTKRLKGRMISFALFVFAGQFFNLLARTNDTFMIVGLKGLSDASIFAIATYVSAILEIPQRSLTAISIPILAKSWKDKDFANIKNIYHKSVSNLLVVGLLIFGLIWLNIQNLVAFLNWISHKQGGGGYDALVNLAFIMGLAKLIDLATGVNAQIIGTSNFWKFDFLTNVLFVIVSIPLNYYLIKHFDLIGLAFSNLIAYTLYNSVRFAFLYFKFKLQPYTWKHGVFLLLSIGLMLLIHQIPAHPNFIIHMLTQTITYTASFWGLTKWMNPAPEILGYFNDFWSNKLMGIFKKR
jgi:O-antigen/teichoic acid export membrane protein